LSIVNPSNEGYYEIFFNNYGLHGSIKQYLAVMRIGDYQLNENNEKITIYHKIFNKEELKG